MKFENFELHKDKFSELSSEDSQVDRSSRSGSCQKHQPSNVEELENMVKMLKLQNDKYRRRQKKSIEKLESYEI